MGNQMLIFPAWEIIEGKNDRTVYQGFFSQQQIHDGLYLTIRCDNDSQINALWSDKIHIALTTHNEFPIFTTQYAFCKEGYFLAIKDACDYIEELAKSVERTRTKLVYLAEDSSYLTAKEIAAMKKISG